jgi:hypothetical protein
MNGGTGGVTLRTFNTMKRLGDFWYFCCTASFAR